VNNNFDNFFNMDKPLTPEMMGNFRPTVSEVVDSLLLLTMQNPLFYKDENLRIAVCSGILYATDELGKAKAQGFIPEGITAGHAGFMLLLGDMMSMTYDEFAGPVEREKFPHNREDFENDLENE
jgi:hypothetical protein